MSADMDDATLDVVRRAAGALTAQDGRGIARRELIELAGSSRVSVHRFDGAPVVAFVQRPRASAFEGLTARELEVAELLAAGASNKDIAAKLVLSVATVKDHVHNILTKSGLKSRAEVAARWHSA